MMVKKNWWKSHDRVCSDLFDSDLAGFNCFEVIFSRFEKNRKKQIYIKAIIKNTRLLMCNDENRATCVSSTVQRHPPYCPLDHDVWKAERWRWEIQGQIQGREGKHRFCGREGLSVLQVPRG